VKLLTGNNGIMWNSVLVRAEKKLLTVLFPDGRAFTLKVHHSSVICHFFHTSQSQKMSMLP
jgi:hypothetical protein